MKRKIVISTLWMIFAVLFFILAGLHRAESRQIIQEFDITRVLGDGASFTVNGISIDKPFQDFANEFNKKYLANQNESNRKANLYAYRGYGLAGLTALLAMVLEWQEYIFALLAKLFLLVKCKKTSKTISKSAVVKMVSSENSHIFIWKAFKEWKSVLEDMLGDILTPELKTKVRKNVTRIEYCDNQTECEELIGQSFDSIVPNNTIDKFRQRYSHLRVYHACRPTDVSSYYKKGVRLSRKEIQVKQFRSIFLSGNFPELTEEMLQQSIKKAARFSYDDGELCLAIDDRSIAEHAGHYLIYGAEYLGALVTQLPIENIEKYRAVLRKIGKPTFLKINLPNTTKYVSDFIIGELIYRMITQWVYCLAHSRMESCLIDFTVTVHEPILPKYIHSHYHPKKIPDPLIMGHKIYDAEIGEYEDVT